MHYAQSGNPSRLQGLFFESGQWLTPAICLTVSFSTLRILASDAYYLGGTNLFFIEKPYFIISFLTYYLYPY
ncbi:hypothetical protein ACSBR1_024551 [Camellia fascicularis]